MAVCIIIESYIQVRLSMNFILKQRNLFSQSYEWLELKEPHMLSSHLHESFRIRMEPAQVLGDEGGSKLTL